MDEDLYKDDFCGSLQIEASKLIGEAPLFKVEGDFPLMDKENNQAGTIKLKCDFNDINVELMSPWQIIEFRLLK